MEVTKRQLLEAGKEFRLISDINEGRHIIYAIENDKYLYDGSDKIAHVVIKDTYFHYFLRLPQTSIIERVYFENIKFV